jgi:hypothetical protein
VEPEAAAEPEAAVEPADSGPTKEQE